MGQKNSAKDHDWPRLFVTRQINVLSNYPTILLHKKVTVVRQLKMSE